METIQGFKGFDKDLKCRDMQYEIGGEYETKEKPVRCTKHGFHFCEHPLDVFGYYPPADSRYTTVEGAGSVSKGYPGDDTKIAVSHIKIGGELALHGMIDAAVKFVFDRVVKTKEKTNEKEKCKASNSGTRGAASNSGYRGAASNSGDRGAAMSIGSFSSTETTVENSIACGLGYDTKARGAINSFIVLAEHDNNKIINVKSAKVDGKKIKADTWYKLIGGKFIVQK
jgi:hypothetical protein